jgi:hypothetical protein
MTNGGHPKEEIPTRTATDPLFTSETALPTFSQQQLLDHFNVSDEIKNIFYEQGQFLNPDRPYNKLKNKKFINVWFKNVIIDGMTFQDCVFEDCRMIGTIVRDCEFHDCEFKRCNTHKIHFERTYIDPTSFVEMPDKRKYANIGVYLFQQLYRNSDEMLQPDFRNAAEYEFRKWQRYELSSKWRNGDAHKQRVAKRWAGNMFFFLISGYGLKPFRVALWFFLFLISVLGFNYGCWHRFDFYSSSGLSVANATLPLAIYYSVVTLSTLGYGDITPRSSFGLLATSAEAILGLVWLALVASVLIKKVLR